MTLPFQPGSLTSLEAAEKNAPRAQTQREKVFEAIVAAGKWGMTDEEVQRKLRMNPSTQRPRRIELVRVGRIQDSGITRRTLSGRRAVVWTAVWPGQQLNLLGRR